MGCIPDCETHRTNPDACISDRGPFDTHQATYFTNINEETDERTQVPRSSRKGHPHTREGCPNRPRTQDNIQRGSNGGNCGGTVDGDGFVG